MSVPEPANPWADAAATLGGAARPAADVPAESALGRFLWAGAASTVHRIARGEGALLAINLSLLVHQGDVLRGLGLGLLSVLTLGAMYAFNDLHDAPTDANNPKKDPRVVGIYDRHRVGGTVALLLLKVATIVVALVAAGTGVALAVGGVMVANLVYSTLLKGVPVIDVAWCGVWGALYASIVTVDPTQLAVVGLMTAVCHLYQALDDREPDAANGITTTAVRSATLSRDVLAGLCLALLLVLRAPFGALAATTAFVPLALFFLVGDPRSGWLLTKLYFGVAWLVLLGIAGAHG